MGEPRPIGILGGTFDPVHFGHLRIALEALEALELAEVRLLPARQPPHRSDPGAPPEARLAMLYSAVADQPGFRVDDRELRRDGLSYMVDTLASFRHALPDRPLCLLLGMDAFVELPRWNRWRQLFELAHLVVLSRPGNWPELPAELTAEVDRRRLPEGSALAGAAAGGVLFQPVTPLDISATRIRALLAAGCSPRYLLPDAVHDYIRTHRLYNISRM